MKRANYLGISWREYFYDTPTGLIDLAVIAENAGYAAEKEFRRNQQSQG